MGTNRWKWLAVAVSIGLFGACSDDPASNPECGNSVVEDGEQCDDGNVIPGDGCTLCMFDTGAGSEICDNEADDDGDGATDCDDTDCAGTDACPSGPACGDGTVDDGEECDDGNTDGGDGCAADCTNESAEVCDDGTDNDGDGDTDCADADCVGTDACPAGECGDGELNAGEECDDGNADDGDGCAADCTIEPECGDGIVNGDEACDDGNDVNGDGCENDCTETPVSPIDCDAAETVVDLSDSPFPLTWTGSLNGSGDDFAPDATCGPVAGTSEDTVLYFEVDQAGTYRISTYSASNVSDTVVTVLSGSCSAAPTACNDNAPSGDAWSELNVLAAAGDAFYVLIESRSVADVEVAVARVTTQGAQGDACAPSDPARPCQAGLACTEGEGGTFTCGEPAGTCANPLDLLSVATGDLEAGGLSASLTALQGTSEETGSCGGEGSEIAVGLTMPRTGVLEVRIADGSDAVVYAGPGCGTPTEYGCGGAGDSFTFDVRSTQSVVFLVDSTVDTLQSATIEVEFFAQGDLGQACVPGDATQGCLAPYVCADDRSICVQTARVGEQCDTMDDGPACSAPFLCVEGDESEYCVADASPTCENPESLGVAGVGAAALSTTMEPDLGTPLYVGSCGARAGTARTIVPSESGILEVQVGDGANGAFLRSTCVNNTTELACDRSFVEPMKIEVTADEPVTLFVDATTEVDVVATVYPLRRIGEACDGATDRCEVGAACSVRGVCVLDLPYSCDVPEVVEATAEDIGRRIDVGLEPDGRDSLYSSPRCGGTDGSDGVALFRSEVDVQVTVAYIQVGATPILSIRGGDCADPNAEVTCIAGRTGDDTVELTFAALAGENYFVIGDAPLAGISAGQLQFNIAELEAPAHCSDREISGTETALDCGGDCEPCPDDSRCRVGSDCTSGSCRDGICGRPLCTDGVRNQGETDVDCGGPCDPCRLLQTCAIDADCPSGGRDVICGVDGRCVGETCEDGVLSGDESDVDCGGSSCLPCEGGDACNVRGDCASYNCTANVCAPATCEDGNQSFGELGADCGGVCPRCDVGGDCDSDDACLSGVCGVRGLCAAPSCDDGVRNGSEPSIDCGGLCADRCGFGARCDGNGDCASDRCVAGVCAR